VLLPDVPWGHICGYPLRGGGDLYGGGHYIESSCANLTPQGVAIKQAAMIFGNGATLNYPPCKKGYLPIVKNKRMYACWIHHEKRKQRFEREGRKWRDDEQPLSIFWSSALDKKDEGIEATISNV
jgi:hypothetical protein